MEKFEKVLLIIFIQVVLFTFLNVGQDWLVALLFPPLFAVTLFYSMLYLFDEEITMSEVWFGLFLAAVAVTSTGVGAHLTANAIHNFVDEELPKIEEDFNKALNISDESFINFSETSIPETLYHYDEIVSHVIIFVGVFLLGVAAYLLTRQGLEKITTALDDFSEVVRKHPLIKPHRVTFKDYVVVSFIGSFLGVLLALMGVEGNVVYYGAVFALLALSITGVKLKQYMKMKHADLKVILSIITLTSYLATTVAYYFLTSSGALTSFAI